MARKTARPGRTLGRSELRDRARDAAGELVTPVTDVEVAAVWHGGEGQEARHLVDA